MHHGGPTKWYREFNDQQYGVNLNRWLASPFSKSSFTYIGNPQLRLFTTNRANHQIAIFPHLFPAFHVRLFRISTWNLATSPGRILLEDPTPRKQIKPPQMVCPQDLQVKAGCQGFDFRAKSTTIPETNSKFAPEAHGWLEYDWNFCSGRFGLFSGAKWLLAFRADLIYNPELDLVAANQSVYRYLASLG